MLKWQTFCFGMFTCSFGILSLILVSQDAIMYPGSRSMPAIASIGNRVIVYGHIFFTIVCTKLARDRKDLQRHCKGNYFFSGSLCVLTLTYLNEAGPLHVELISIVALISWVMDDLKCGVFRFLCLSDPISNSTLSLIEQHSSSWWLPYSWIPNDLALIYYISTCATLPIHFFALRNRYNAVENVDPYMSVHRVVFFFFALMCTCVLLEFLSRSFYIAVAFARSELIGQRDTIEWIWSHVRKYYQSDQERLRLSQQALDIQSNPSTGQGRSRSSRQHRPRSALPPRRNFLLVFVQNIGIGGFLVLVLILNMEISLRRQLGYTGQPPFVSLKGTLTSTISLNVPVLGTIEKIRLYSRERNQDIVRVDLDALVPAELPLPVAGMLPFRRRLLHVVQHPHWSLLSIRKFVRERGYFFLCTYFVMNMTFFLVLLCSSPASVSVLMVLTATWARKRSANSPIAAWTYRQTSPIWELVCTGFQRLTGRRLRHVPSLPVHNQSVSAVGSLEMLPISVFRPGLGSSIESELAIASTTSREAPPARVISRPSTQRQSATIRSAGAGSRASSRSEHLSIPQNSADSLTSRKEFPIASDTNAEPAPIRHEREPRPMPLSAVSSSEQNSRGRLPVTASHSRAGRVPKHAWSDSALSRRYSKVHSDRHGDSKEDGEPGPSKFEYRLPPQSHVSSFFDATGAAWRKGGVPMQIAPYDQWSNDHDLVPPADLRHPPQVDATGPFASSHVLGYRVTGSYEAIDAGTFDQFRTDTRKTGRTSR